MDVQGQAQLYYGSPARVNLYSKNRYYLRITCTFGLKLFQRLAAIVYYLLRVQIYYFKMDITPSFPTFNNV